MVACPKPTRPTPQRDWREKAIETAKKIVRLEGECERCGRKAPFYKMHGAHIVSSKYSNVCADLDNLICLCCACHVSANNSAHLNERLFHEWLESKHPARLEALKIEARKQYIKIDFEEIYTTRLAQYKKALEDKAKAEEVLV